MDKGGGQESQEVPMVKENPSCGFSLKGASIMIPVQAGTTGTHVVFVWSFFGVSVVCRTTQEFCVEGGIQV